MYRTRVCLKFIISRTKLCIAAHNVCHINNQQDAVFKVQASCSCTPASHQLIMPLSGCLLSCSSLAHHAQCIKAALSLSKPRQIATDISSYCSSYLTASLLFNLPVKVQLEGFINAHRQTSFYYIKSARLD